MKLSGRWLDDNFVQDTGSGDDSTVTFGLSQTPHSAASVIVSLDGLRKSQGAGSDEYSVNVGAATITFVTAPATGQDILVTYMKG